MVLRRRFAKAGIHTDLDSALHSLPRRSFAKAGIRTELNDRSFQAKAGLIR